MSEARPMRKLPAKAGKFLRDRRGVAAIEMALIAPVLVLLYFGTVDLANWYMAHRRLVIAGSTIADITTQEPATTTGNKIRGFWIGIGDIIKPLPIDSIKLTLRDFRKDGASSKQKWQYSYMPTGNPAGQPAPTCGTDPVGTQLQDLANTEMTDANDILVVEVCTTIKPIALQVFGFGEIPMRYRISMRPRLGKIIDCTSNCTIF